MPTQEVSFVVPSPAWTGNLDVTLANLLADVVTKDFTVLYDSVEQGLVELAFWAKTSQTLLSYSGSTLTTGVLVSVRRKTPNAVVQSVTPQTTILSALWNAEFDRIVRWREEVEAFGISIVSGLVSDTAFSSGWDGVTLDAPTKNAVHDIFNTPSTISFSPLWTILTGSTVEFSSGSTLNSNGQVNVSGTVSASTAVNIFVPSRAKVNLGGEWTHNSASQTWVHQNTPMSEPQFRLNNQSLLTPLPNSTTLFYTHDGGNCIFLYNTTDLRWEPFYFNSAAFISTSGLSDNLPYDVFAYNNAGTLSLELVVWSSFNTRATALDTSLLGIPSKTGDLSRRYVGTVMVASNNVWGEYGNFNLDDKIVRFSIWNMYRRRKFSSTNFQANTETISGSTFVPHCGYFWHVGGFQNNISVQCGFNWFGASSAANVFGVSILRVAQANTTPINDYSMTAFTQPVSGQIVGGGYNQTVSRSPGGYTFIPLVSMTGGNATVAPSHASFSWEA